MGMTGTDQADRSRWQARPGLARALSLTVFVVPVAASYGVTRLAAPFVTDLPLLGRIIALGSVAIIVGLVAERILRRVLPLAALLRMTMLFPDHAPSRFKLARAAGNTGILEERARAHPDETAGEAATRILGLLTALSAHDRRTRGHSERVRVFTDVLAAELHLPEEARDRLRWASLLHDLGKVGVPARVLNKPASLDEDEWAMIRCHPDKGAALAGPLLGWLGEWGAAISQHHERFDGKGYPRGLAGHEIALAGRIVAVADTFEVMTAARSYKRPTSVAAARRELADVAGTQLDATCVRAFLGASLPRVLWAIGPLALLVNLPFLRGLAEAGRVVEQAGTVAAGQAATVAVAAVVIAVPSAGAGVSAAGLHSEHQAMKTQSSASAAAGSHAATASPSGRTASSHAPKGSNPADVAWHPGAGTHAGGIPALPRSSSSPGVPGSSTSPGSPGSSPSPTTPGAPVPSPSPSAHPSPSLRAITPEWASGSPQVNATGVLLTWLHNTGPHASPVTAYRLYRSLTGTEQGTKIADLPASATSYQDSGSPGKGLLPDTYYYVLVAQTSAGTSTTVQVTVRIAAAPVTVTATKLVALGTAANFAVLAGSTITNTGVTTVTGYLGLSPGTSVTGLLAGPLIGTVFAADGVASQAKTDLAGAYDDAAGRATTATIPVELGGTTQTPGVYDSAAGTFGITGTLTLDAQGDPNAVFIFKAASTLITASSSQVKLINGARASNVFWQVGSSATLGTYSVLRGNVMAQASITVTTGATVDGRMLARTGAVTLDSDSITRSG
jgi:HD-GYP domain-containing protein (c-di-GMP phosphodiesterase class II)